MPFKTLGEALVAKGFSRAGFYPPDAFEKDPLHPKITYGDFNPDVPYVDGAIHGATAGKLLDLRYGSGAFTAKGNPAGAWHGRETTWQIEDALMIRFLDLEPSFDLESGWNNEDLKYVCNQDGLFAYEWLIRTHSGLVASEVKKPGEGTASAKTPIDQRAEEVRAILRQLGQLLNSATRNATLTGLVTDSCWPFVKPFVIAGLAAYRKIMEG